MKRIVLILFFALSISLFSQAECFALTGAPDILGESAVLIDAKTGDILYEKDKDALKEPASTTKMITCLLALENLPLDKVITIDPISPFTGGSRISVIEGEELTTEQLVYSLMLLSANDAAVALAIEISGSVENFAALMNQRAAELGAKNPSFKNPNGLHEDGHLASAYDLAMIAKGAMENPEFRKIVSTLQYTIPATNKQPERDYIRNTNLLLFDSNTKVPVRGVMTPAKYDGATGIKTGYTSNAGGCLVASAERDGTELIAVVMKSTELGRFGDAIAILDYGFDNYYTYKAVDSTASVDDAAVSRGAVNHVAVKIQGDKYVTLPKEASVSVISTKIVMDGAVKAPVSAGQQLGKVEIYEGGDVIGDVPVVAAADVAAGGLLSVFGVEDSVSARIVRYAVIAAVFVCLMLILYLILKIRYNRRRKARRRRRAEEIAMERHRKLKETEQRRWPY